MARPKQLKNPTKKLISIETDQYTELIRCGVSNFNEWVRERIDDYILINDDLNSLKQRLNEKNKEKQDIIFEIETIEAKIKEIENQQKENENNKELEKEIIDTIQKVIENEYNGDGITKERIHLINQNRLTSTQLKRVIRNNNIKIISPAEKTTSKIIANESQTKRQKHNRPVREVEPFKELITRFKNDWKRYNQNNSFSDLTAKEYLKNNQDKYRARCNTKNISWAQFQREVLKLD